MYEFPSLSKITQMDTRPYNNQSQIFNDYRQTSVLSTLSKVFEKNSLETIVVFSRNSHSKTTF